MNDPEAVKVAETLRSLAGPIEAGDPNTGFVLLVFDHASKQVNFSMANAGDALRAAYWMRKIAGALEENMMRPQPSRIIVPHPGVAPN